MVTQMRITRLKPQKGVALITVLMILAIMVTIAATMTGRLTLSLKRTEGLSFAQKVYWYGQASADLGRMILDQDFADSEVISLDQVWATPDMVFPLENGNLAGQLSDQRGCFNINAVGLQDKGNSPAAPVIQFRALLEAIGVNDYSAEMIAESTRDWIDENDKSDASQGAEDSVYQGRAVPHLAANNLMVDISELRAVQGVGQRTYEKIKPYLCAVPSQEQLINVNTVPQDQPEILYAMFKDEFNLPVSDFIELLEDRPTSGWNSVNDFFAHKIFSDITVSAITKKQFTVTSDFFRLDGLVEYEDRLMRIQLLFEIESKKAKVIRYQSGGFK